MAKIVNSKNRYFSLIYLILQSSKIQLLHTYHMSVGFFFFCFSWRKLLLTMSIRTTPSCTYIAYQKQKWGKFSAASCNNALFFSFSYRIGYFSGEQFLRLRLSSFFRPPSAQAQETDAGDAEILRGRGSSSPFPKIIGREGREILNFPPCFHPKQNCYLFPPPHRLHCTYYGTGNVHVLCTT